MVNLACNIKKKNWGNDTIKGSSVLCCVCYQCRVVKLVRHSSGPCALTLPMTQKKLKKEKVKYRHIK